MQDHDMEMLMKLLSTAEGKKLIAIMQSGSGELMSKAAAAARSGDYRQVQELLTPVLSGTEAEKIAKGLRSSFG